MKHDYYVEVCAVCFTASCWHGTLMCDKAETASTTRMTASKLHELGLEHPSNYSRARLLEVCGMVEEVQR
jgi:hypothetical protein